MKTTLYIITCLLLLFTVSCNRSDAFDEYQNKILAIANGEEAPQYKISKLDTILKEISGEDVIKNKKNRTRLMAVCLNSIANQYEKQGQYKVALNYYDRAIDSDSTNGKIYHNRGYIYMLLGKGGKAESDFNHAIQLVPDYSPTYNNLGVLYTNRDDEKALKYLNKAIELDPDYLDAYSNRSTVFANLKQYDKSIEDNTYVLSKDPNHLRAYMERAVVYIDTNDYNKAFADLDAALKIDSVNPYVLYNKAVLYEKTGQESKAYEYFMKTSMADPDGHVGKVARYKILQMSN